METESQTCGVCSIPYDNKDHPPRVLINCGHSLCSSCLTKIIKTPSLRKCPFDNHVFDETQNSLDKFPLNFALLALLEGKNKKICQAHGEELTIFCFQDNLKICMDCALFGEHKGHNMKKIKELKAKGSKVKKDLEEVLKKFKKNQSEKDFEKETLKMEIFSIMGSQFEEIKKILRTKELEWRRHIENLFEEKSSSQSRSLLRIEAEKALEEIDQACQEEENLGLLDQDFSSTISKLQPQVTKEEISKVSDETLRMTDCFRSFLANQAKTLKNFDFLNERITPGQPVLTENLIENTKQKLELFNSLLTFDVNKMTLIISVKNPNPINKTIDLDEFNKVRKISVEFQRYNSLFQETSSDLNALSEILHKLNNYTALKILFPPSNLTDDRALHLLNLLFSRVQYLTDIEICLEGREIRNEAILFFCNEILPKAASLKDLTIKLGSPLVTESILVLAQSLSSFSKTLESLKLKIKDPSLTDEGIEKIYNAIGEVKELSLYLRGTEVTDRSLRVLGNHPCMKSLKEFSLDVSETKITIEGINVIFTRIPKDIIKLMLDFEGITMPDKVLSLFEGKVRPKLQLVEHVFVRLGREELKPKMTAILNTIRQDAEIKRKKMGYQLNQGNNCSQ